MPEVAPLKNLERRGLATFAHEYCSGNWLLAIGEPFPFEIKSFRSPLVSLSIVGWTRVTLGSRTFERNSPRPSVSLAITIPDSVDREERPLLPNSVPGEARLASDS